MPTTFCWLLVQPVSEELKTLLGGSCVKQKAEAPFPTVSPRHQGSVLQF